MASGSGHDSEHAQPLLLDLLDAHNCHVTEPVIGVSWADAQGAFWVAAATKNSLHVFTIRRYVLWLLGDMDADSDSAAPLAEQLCQVSHEHADVAAIHWTQRADGLLCADAGGHVTMYEALTSGGGEDVRLSALKLLWQGQSTGTQTLLSAGRSITLPSASAAPGSKTVLLWWPPKHAEQAQPALSTAPELAKKAAEETFLSETAKILANLGSGQNTGSEQGAGRPADAQESTGAEEEAEEASVATEQLRLNAPVVALEWSHGDLHSDADEPGSGPMLLPPAQPALLTLTADGVMRIWVEVTLTPSSPSASAATLPKRSPEQSKSPQQASTKSHFCTSLLIQPPAGAWDVQLAAPRVCWGVPSGPEPATRPELRAAKVLWIVGVGPSPDMQEDRLLLWAVAGLRGVVIGGRSGSRSAPQPRAVLWGQHSGSLIRQSQAEKSLSASVIVANDTPMLHIMESCRDVACPEICVLRHYRVDTVEDSESMPGSLQLPHSPGSVLPPRQLPAHALVERQLLAHAGRITCIRAQESCNMCATLDALGAVLIWQLQPLQPLRHIVSRDDQGGPVSRDHTAIAWAQSDSDSANSGRSQGACLLGAASSAGVDVTSLHRSAPEEGSADPGWQAEVLSSIATPAGSGPVRWLIQAPGRSADSEAASITLIGWMASKDRDELAIWQLDVHAGSAASLTAADMHGMPLPKGSGRITCMAHERLAKGLILIAGDADCNVHVFLVEAHAGPPTHLATILGAEDHGSVVALTSWQRGALIAAAHNGAVLRVFRARLAEGKLEYPEVAKVDLPDMPTDLAALHFPVPTLAVGCEGRGFLVVSCKRKGKWTTCAQLSPTSLPGAALCPLEPPHLLIAAPGSQMQHQPSLAACDESGQSLPKRVFQAGGPLAPWSPPAMKVMLIRGRRAAAAAALRRLLRLLKQLEAALDKRVSMDAADSAARAVSLPSKPVLQWARQVAEAAGASSLSNGSEPADSKSSGANIGPTLGQDGQADTSAAAMQGSTSKPADSAHPFAFDIGALGMGSPAAEEHSSPEPVSQPEKATPAANVDPFAFDMGAFGMGTIESTTPPVESQPTAATLQRAELPEMRPSQPAPKQAADPYAFDMGAFNMAGMSAAAHKHEHSSSYATDEVGQDSSPAATQEAVPKPAAQSDPYAFDTGAFGMAGASESSASEAPVQQEEAVPKPAAKSDPYAFDMGAFGMAGAASSPADDRRMQDTAAEPQHSSSAAHQAKETQPAAQADPFASDLGAFGMGGMTSTELPSSSLREDKQAQEHDTTHEAQESGQGETVSRPAADPYAFDMGAFGLSAPPEAAQSNSSASSIAAKASHQQRAASATEAQHAQQGSSAAPVRLGSVRHASSRQQHQQHQGISPSAAGNLSLEPPREEPFDPLTDSEMQQLERLLLRAAAVLESRSCLGHEEDEPEEAVQEDLNIEALGLGPLDVASAQQLMGLASCLIGLLPEQAQLDMPAQRLIASMQVALLLASTAAEEMGQPQQTETVSSGRSLQQSDTAAYQQEGGSWEEAGLLPGLSMQDILWVLLARPASHEALLESCVRLVPADEVVEVTHEPKIDFTYSGQQKLDLGFGASGGGPAQPAQALSWERLRKAGVGFWLTEPKQVRQLAEKLAKAQFAAKRDPHDCTLMYIALGKKSLLQGLFRSAQHKKQAEFLGRSFDSDKDRAAAAKNAFVLLAQHRPQLAAAFFILGGHLKDAVGVCAHELADPQLAIFVARLLEPKQGALLSNLLANELLPRAQESGDAWSMAAVQWLQGNKQASLQTLVHSIGSKTDSKHDPWKGSPNNGGLASETQLLDYLYHCTASASAPWRGDSAMLGALCSTAQRSADALEAAGLPAMALEALSMARLLCRGESQVADALWKGRSTSLAASAALWPVLSANSLSAESCATWHDNARAMLGQMQQAGARIDAESAMALLTRHMTLLAPSQHAAQEDTLEAATPFSDISSRFSLSGGHRPSGSGAKPGGFSGTLYDGGHVLEQLRDKVFAVCIDQAGEWSGEGRPIVAATAHKGLLELEATPAQTLEASAPSETAFSGVMSDSSASVKGSVFSALLTDMMEAVRWPAASSAGSPKGSPKNSPKNSPKAARALLPTTSSSALKPNNSPLSRVSISADRIATSALASHPYRPLYLSGCASGEIFLWQYGSPQAMAGYTPLPATSGVAPPPASGSIFSAPKSMWAIDRPGALAALGNWGQPQSVCFSEGGERFAAIGQGGLAAAWRLDAPQFTRSDSGPLARSDWCHQVMSKRGVDIAYVGGGSSVIAAGGYNMEGGNIALWDTVAPLCGGPIASLDHHPSLVTALQVLPGGRLLASADETGNVAVADLRMLGSARQPLLWQAKSAGGGVTCLASGPRPGLVSGSREGVLTSWTVDSGVALQTIDITQVQPSALQKRLPAKGASFFSEAFRSTRQSAAHVITGLASCPEGIVSGCLDGTIRFHPML